MFDVWGFAQAFVVRELVHDLFNIADDMTDIEAYLAYRPWAGEKAINAYV